jgi:hypothetical protein
VVAALAATVPAASAIGVVHDGDVWCGYVQYNRSAPDTVHIFANWTVPNVKHVKSTDGFDEEDEYDWVGFGGVDKKTLYQGGTGEARSKDGRVKYVAFWEIKHHDDPNARPHDLTMFQANGMDVGHIAPGDRIHAEIESNAGGWYVHVYDFGRSGDKEQLSGEYEDSQHVSVTSADVVDEWAIPKQPPPPKKPIPLPITGLADAVTFTNTYLSWGTSGEGQDFVSDAPGFHLFQDRIERRGRVRFSPTAPVPSAPNPLSFLGGLNGNGDTFTCRAGT